MQLRVKLWKQNKNASPTATFFYLDFILHYTFENMYFFLEIVNFIPTYQHFMIKYLDMVEWLVCSCSSKSYTGGCLFPGRSNLPRQANG